MTSVEVYGSNCYVAVLVKLLLQDMMGNLSTSSAVAAFDKMEEKVMAMEAGAESTAILVGGDGLNDKFALLESGTGEGLQIQVLSCVLALCNNSWWGQPWYTGPEEE